MHIGKDNKLTSEVICEDCLKYLSEDRSHLFDLTFLDPPFNQGKEYNRHNDSLPDDVYWDWMMNVCQMVLRNSSVGASLYFMQREKNAQHVLKVVRDSGWHLQNIIIWKKKTSAVPGTRRYGKHYQIIVFATKGKRPRVFNRLRIDPPLPYNYKQRREGGVYLTDVWDDIRELTAGYFAGDEALRDVNGSRVHKQQTPVALLTRIILSSTYPGDTVLDPFAGTGTTPVVANQLKRNCISVEIDDANIDLIKQRINMNRKADHISNLIHYYRYTDQLCQIWESAESEDIPKSACSDQLSIINGRN